MQMPLMDSVLGNSREHTAVPLSVRAPCIGTKTWYLRGERHRQCRQQAWVPRVLRILPTAAALHSRASHLLSGLTFSIRPSLLLHFSPSLSPASFPSSFIQTQLFKLKNKNSSTTSCSSGLLSSLQSQLLKGLITTVSSSSALPHALSNSLQLFSASTSQPKPLS